MGQVAKYMKDHFVPLPPPPKSLVEVVEEQVVSSSSPNYLQNKKHDEKHVTVTEKIELLDEDKPVLHRRLKNRHINLIALGGTIGTALFVSIGTVNYTGGPASLLLGFTFWCIPVLLVTASCAEMVCKTPIASPFVKFAGLYVDEAFSVCTGWNFWFLECALIPFEVTAVGVILNYWVDGYSPAIPLAVQVFLYFLINVLTIKVYGETEFWMACGKVVLAVGLMCFTFITMVGGNPQHDAYGFRNWHEPAPFLEYIHTGALGRFQGWLAAVISACFTIAGPEYVSMAAAECENPRVVLPKAYKQVAYRLTLFFIGGALCVGIVCAPNDPNYLAAYTDGKPGAGSSPYVIAMTNMGIKVLPHIVNGLLLTSAFSAGNSYTYCSSRLLYGMALDGKAPKIFSHCTRSGIPIYSILMSNCWALLSFLQLGSGSQQVLDWIVNLVTSSQLLNFLFISITYIHFYNACKVQGFDRNTLPFKGWGQPYISYIAAAILVTMIGVSGYTVFLPGAWSVKTFLFSYLMVFIDIGLYIFWKILKRTHRVKPEDVDLHFMESEIEEYEYAYYALKGELAELELPWWKHALKFKKFW